MMIKVNGEYLDFNDDIEVESQIKLFEEISTSNGDYSYSFDLAKTSKNLAALGLPFPDTIKSIYQNVQCELVDNEGFRIHSGGLQVNKITDRISCTFFGGNNDWFGLLSNPISSLPLYKYDINFNGANIMASWLLDKGVVFPILDTGALITRSFANVKVEDFIACFYVKTLFGEIFNPLGIKLEGDLIEDATYNKLVVASNGRSQDEVRNRSCYVNKTTSQLNQPGPVTITFQDETTYPFFDGSMGNFNITTSEYTSDVKTRVDTNVQLFVSSVVGAPGFSVFNLNYRINGSIHKSFSYSVNTAGGTLTRALQVPLNAGDVLTISITVTGGNNLNIISGTLKITPVYIYKVFGNSSVPNWTQGEFVSNILRIFNVLPSYNAASKTLTLDLFNKIKTKESIDVSDSITINEIDFSSFVSNYGKNNYFKYQASDDEDLREYNISNFISYGSGNLSVDNDFIENSADVLESDFTSPITYLNGVFDMSMERFNFVELEDIYEKSITSVTDSGGTPRFNIATASTFFAVGDLVRLTTVLDSYVGEWVVITVTATYIEVNGPSFDASTTGTATLVRHKFTTDDNVYLFVNVHLVDTTFFSSKSSIILDDITYFTQTSVAFFNLLDNNRAINDVYKQSLSFGSVNNPLSYQQTILQTYWPIFSAILNDPVMLRVLAYFNRTTYNEIKTFLRPLRVKTNETNNLYYLNRITGYKGGHEPCDGELIKL